MEKVTDWIKLWKELVEQPGPFRSFRRRSEKTERKRLGGDKWKERAEGFDEKVSERWSKPDSHRDFIVSTVKSFKDATVLDIGAGTGAWAVHLSPFVRKVTAVDPSESMRKILKSNLGKADIHNVEVLDGTWPAIKVEAHDFALSSHSAYGCSDLPGFVGTMTKTVRHTCFMLLRAPDPDGLMAKASRMIWGQPHDSPNFQVAYNAMLQMGIFPNVLMEEKDLWPGWTNKNMDEAFERIRSRFRLEEGSEYDRRLKTLLEKHLIEIDGEVHWPSEVRTALIYWDASNGAA